MVAKSSDIMFDEIGLEAIEGRLVRLWNFTKRHPTIVGGVFVLVVMVVLTIISPYLSKSPLDLNPINRLKTPSAENWFGTDNLGRDIYTRTLYGGRISLTVGLSVAIFATLIGLVIGLISGYIRAVDAVMMRIMDGLMAIPEILLAVSLVAITLRESVSAGGVWRGQLFG